MRTGFIPAATILQLSWRIAAEMHAAVMERTPTTDVLVMAAAVADYRPAQVAEHKIKKGEGGLVLALERTVDILQAVAAAREQTERPGLVVGFAAETENLLANAQDKLARKRLDMIVANDVSSADSGFEVENNRVTLLTPAGKPEPLPLMSKADVAERVVARVAELWQAKHGAASV